MPIPEIYSSGYIYEKIDGENNPMNTMINNDRIGFPYIITKYYNTNFNILGIEQLKKIIYDLINILVFLKHNNYFLYDLKIENIGYDENYNIIIIDYDINTIKKQNTDKIFYGSFRPYYTEYIININEITDFTEINKKIESTALCQILLEFFYKPIHNPIYGNINIIDVLQYGSKYYMSEEYIKKCPESLIDISILKNNSDLNNYFLNIKNTSIINDFLDSLEPKFINIPNFYIMIRNMILKDDMGLLHPLYDNIYNYYQLNEIINIYNKKRTKKKYEVKSNNYILNIEIYD